MDVQGRKIWVVLAKSVAVPQCPEKPGIIRVKSYKQSLVIESDGKAGCKGKRSRICVTSRVGRECIYWQNTQRGGLEILS